MVIIMRQKRKLVSGVGINDADYSVFPDAGGMCPFYRKWHSILNRSYGEKYHKNKPTYRDCSVCEERLTFSNFRAWMIKQDWEGKQIDKDILSVGNKVYSPEKCVFVSKEVNVFIIDSGSARGSLPIGVSFHKQSGRLAAQCGNPFKRKNEFLGLFNSQEAAHLAWKKRKHEHACKLADLQKDERVADALRVRYL